MWYQDEAVKEPPAMKRDRAGDTQNRIFGNYDEKIENVKTGKRQQAQAEASYKDLEVTGTIKEAMVEEKAPEVKASNQNGLDGQNFQHTIRYSTFMDQDSSNQGRIHDQKMQQKQWLDQQISERKSLDRKNKKSDDLFQADAIQRDANSTSQSNLQQKEKRDMNNQIREYNEEMAKQKRAKEKKSKEDDKLIGNEPKATEQQLKEQEIERKQIADDKEDLIQKERAMSRDIRQMSSQN